MGIFGASMRHLLNTMKNGLPYVFWDADHKVKIWKISITLKSSEPAFYDCFWDNVKTQ